MRIISGTHRRRTLLSPHGTRVTRPIPDRVKQSLFDRLWSMDALDCTQTIDLFAGTGSLGIEALSRGVDHCVFVERDRSAHQLLTQNLANLELTHRATVLRIDVMMAGAINLLAGYAAGLVFVDPPYPLTNESKSMERVAALVEKLASVVQPGGMLSLRTNRHIQPAPISKWHGPQSCEYGSTTVHLYQKPDDEGTEGTSSVVRNPLSEKDIDEGVSGDEPSAVIRRTDNA